MKKSLLILSAFIGLSTILFISLTARPQYSILQTYGTKCENCHYNVQGGGARTPQGFLARKDMSIIKPSWLGIASFFDKVTTTNSVLDDKVIFGTDFRYQSAKFPKVGDKTGANERLNFLMQFSPYLVIKPLSWLELEGFYNLGYDLVKDHRYVSQSRGSASVIIKPSEDLPSLRAGYFQPTIGTKYDDHTMYIRKLRIGSAPLFPDDYAEIGAQLDYTAQKWFDVSVGVFDSKSMSALQVTNKSGKTIPVVDTGSISAALRAFVTPEIMKGVSTFFGGTYFVNKDFYISSVFFNIGLPDKISLMTEYTRAEKKDAFLSLSFLAELTYQLHESVLPFVRVERGVIREKTTKVAIPAALPYETPYYQNQYVFGVHINVLPFIDLLPEYRITHWEHYAGYTSQLAVQLHVFY